MSLQLTTVFTYAVVGYICVQVVRKAAQGKFEKDVFLDSVSGTVCDHKYGREQSNWQIGSNDSLHEGE